jgi:hypothetical protein
MFRIGGSAGTGITSGLDRKPFQNGSDPTTMIPQLGSLPRNTINQPTRTPTGIGFGTIPGFLTGLGINIVSAPPRGRGLTGLLSTVGDAAKEPFSQFQDAKFKEKQAADEFARDLLLKKIGQKEDQFEIVPPEVAKAELGPAYNENTLYQRNLKTNKIEAKTIGPKEVIKDAGNEYLKQIDKKAGEDDVKKIQDAETAFANANKFQGTIDTLSILANTPDDELRTGAFSELRTSLTKIGRELGLEVDLQNVELAELLRTVGGKVAIESLQGFKGAISNKELDFVQSINPGLNMSKEGIKLQLALLNRGNQISKKYYTEVISPFVEKNGGLRGTLNGKTFRQLQVEFYENNPFVTDEIRNKIASVQNKIDPKYKKNIITDNGINYIVVGDKVFKLPNQGG